jgi:branched-chain amino acid transport system substrate-binding protein
MFTRSLVAAGCLIATLGVVACGGEGDDADPAATESASKAVTIYSSYPLQGAGRRQSIAAVNGAKLALEQAGGKAGNVTVTYKPLDDATAQAANWTPEQTSANARKAAQDESTAVYLGEFNSGATAVSLPILNEAGIAQISPSNTAVGLTSDEPGANPGEPDKYYPTGQRTFARIVPKDTIQGAALATLMKEDGCTNVQLLNDKEVYGAGLGARPEDHLQRGHRQERRQLPLAGRRRQDRGRGLHGLLRHHRQ